MIVLDHSERPETVPEKPPSVSVIVDPFFSDQRRKLTVLVGFDVPATMRVLEFTVVCATGSVIVTVDSHAVPPPDPLTTTDLTTSSKVSLSMTVIS